MHESNYGAPAPPQEPRRDIWSLHLGAVRGIPIRLHLTFFLLPLLVLAAGTSPDVAAQLLFVLAVFGCVLLHELGHALAAQRCGIGVREIVLYPFGGVARVERIPTPRQELGITLAGPAVNVAIAAVLAAWLATTGGLALAGLRADGLWAQKLLTANLVLACFNLLPVFPMDGGRILRALLALRIGPERATLIAARVGQCGALLLGFWGLLMNPLLVVFAVLIYLAAGQEAALYRGKDLIKGFAVREAMVTDLRTLPADATLGEAADLLLRTSHKDFPVVHGDAAIGVLSRQALLRGLAERGPAAYVTGVMEREFPVSPPDADLWTVTTEQITERPFVVVQDGGGALLGMVTAENLTEFLAVQRLTGSARASHVTT